MRKKLIEKIEIPEGILCILEGSTLKFKKDSLELSKEVNLPFLKIKASKNEIIIECDAGNKKEFKIIKSLMAHIYNIFKGLNEKFTYKLEACNVHFPMILKVIGDKLSINNFLGEKTPRFAKILPGTNVDIKGQQIIVSSHDIHSAGHTAANMEKATKIKSRDKRIFQDGIYIVERPGGAL